MPGPLPKPVGVRARRHKTSTAAKLRSDATIIAPELPPLPLNQEWHELVRTWWEDIWASPMAPEYTESDRHGLFKVAMLHQDFWTAESSKGRQDAAKEIRLQEMRYGLSPIDRRRLQWEIERTEEAKDRGTRRRAGGSTSRQPDEGDDPRLTLVQ
ncbi:phage terminase small subunit [Kocuria carniphila]